MATQTLYTASTSTGLDVAGNVLTGDVLLGNEVTTGGIGIANSQTSGTIDIGTFGSRSGQITIGSDGNTASTRIDGGSGGIRIGTALGGNIEVTTTTGNFNVTASKVRILDESQATSITNGSTEFKGGVGITKNVVVGENCIVGEDFRALDTTRSLLMFNGNDTGSVSIGGGMTTAAINLGSALQTGGVNILGTGSGFFQPALNITGGISTGASSSFSGDLLLTGALDITSAIRKGPATSDAELFSTTTTGDILIGEAMTSGAMVLGGGSMSGAINLVSPIVFIYGSIRGSGVGVDQEIFDSTTTGDINVGSFLSTGDINLGQSSQTGQARVLSTANATSSTTGALTVAGGASIEKQLVLGEGLTLGPTKTTFIQNTSQTTGVFTSGRYGQIDTVTLSVGAHSTITFLMTNANITTNSHIVLTTQAYSANGMPIPVVESIGSGSAQIRIANGINATANGVLSIGFIIL